MKIKETEFSPYGDSIQSRGYGVTPRMCFIWLIEIKHELLAIFFSK